MPPEDVVREDEVPVVEVVVFFLSQMFLMFLLSNHLLLLCKLMRKIRNSYNYVNNWKLYRFNLIT